jgi:RimJ/RimL family protein N-acetyltransferase
MAPTMQMERRQPPNAHQDSFVSFLPFATPRLVANQFQLADAAELAGYRSDAETARYQGWAAPYSVAEAHRLIAGQLDVAQPKAGEWLQIALRLDGELIGDVAVGMSRDGRVADIGYTLAPPYRHRGFAVEAVGALADRVFALTAVERLRASLDPRNRASARVVEQLGFRFTGCYDVPQSDPDASVDDDVYALNRESRAAWVARSIEPPNVVCLVDITAHSVRAVRRLEVHGSQRRLVADVVASLADAQVPEVVDGAPVVPWYRAIEADDQLVGFVMLAEQTDAHPEAYLWRLLIDRSHQRRHIGEAAIGLVTERLRGLGQTRLMTSWVGDGGAAGFYLGLGFVPTGRELEDGEIEALLTL